MTRKIQELTLDKIAFFTNITHEFRTPITLIIGPIERALKLSYNPQVIEQLHFVERNSKYLLSLVNQLMDFRKVESGKLEIVKSRNNFLKFANELIIPFEVFAKERDITVKRYFRMPSPEISYDEEAMHKVLTNLLSNAIKFTPNGGSVSLFIALLPPADNPQIHALHLCQPTQVAVFLMMTQSKYSTVSTSRKDKPNILCTDRLEAASDFTCVNASYRCMGVKSMRKTTIR